MKPTAVTHRLSAALLSRVDRLVRLIDSEEVGQRSRSALLREALAIGVSKMERQSPASLSGETSEGLGH